MLIQHGGEHEQDNGEEAQSDRESEQHERHLRAQIKRERSHPHGIHVRHDPDENDRGPEKLHRSQATHQPTPPQDNAESEQREQRRTHFRSDAAKPSLSPIAAAHRS